MRRNEINGRWWEFTPKQTVITKEIPRAQRVYLTDSALQLIGGEDNLDYVFKCHTDKNRHITERAVSHAVRRNLLGYEPKKTGVVKKTPGLGKSKRKIPFVVAEKNKLNIAHFRPHDLRRTCSTFMSMIGFTDAIVDAILAHLKKGEIRTYNKNKYDREKQQALQAWDRKLTSIVTGQKSNVVTMTRKTV